MAEQTPWCKPIKGPFRQMALSREHFEADGMLVLIDAETKQPFTYVRDIVIEQRVCDISLMHVEILVTPDLFK